MYCGTSPHAHTRYASDSTSRHGQSVTTDAAKTAEKNQKMTTGSFTPDAVRSRGMLCRFLRDLLQHTAIRRNATQRNTPSVKLRTNPNDSTLRRRDFCPGE